MLSHRSLRFTPLTLLALAGGCASWHFYDPAQLLQPGQPLPYQMRATRSDRSRVELTGPFVRSDSLYGRARGDTVAVPLTDIAGLERSRFSVSRTAALVVGAPLVGFTVAYVVVCGIGNCEAQTDLVGASLSR